MTIEIICNNCKNEDNFSFSYTFSVVNEFETPLKVIVKCENCNDIKEVNYPSFGVNER
jgi:RNase P subunit RPR2